MSKKTISVICWTICIAFLCVGLYFLSSFFGNPVSAALSKASANRYLKENHADMDFEIEKVSYDPKSGGYCAKIISPTSIDSHFSIWFDGLGRYSYDTFSNIANGGNTFSRLYLEYWDLAERILADCPLNISMGGGELRSVGLLEIYDFIDENGERRHYTLTKDYGLDMSTLTLDGAYDVCELGRNHGWLYVYIDDPVVSLERAAELLLELKSYMDQQGVYFYAVEFNLRQPRGEDGKIPDKQINLFEFLYSDIYEDGLTERIEASWRITKEHHAIQDGLKKEAELLVPYFIEIPEDVN